MEKTNHEGSQDIGFVKISEMIANPLIKVYKAGQLGLVFIFIGLLLITGAQINSGNKYSNISILLGVILIFMSFLLFLYMQLKNPTIKSSNIDKGKEVIDNLQLLSINLVGLTGRLQAFSFKYINEVNAILDIGMPYIQELPFIPEKIKKAGIKAKDIQDTVVNFSQKSESIIKEVEKALETSDVKKFEIYVNEIEKLNLQFNDFLKK